MVPEFNMILIEHSKIYKLYNIYCIICKMTIAKITTRKKEEKDKERRIKKILLKAKVGKKKGTKKKAVKKKALKKKKLMEGLYNKKIMKNKKILEDVKKTLLTIHKMLCFEYNGRVFVFINNPKKKKKEKYTFTYNELFENLTLRYSILLDCSTETEKNYTVGRIVEINKRFTNAMERLLFDYAGMFYWKKRAYQDIALGTVSRAEKKNIICVNANNEIKRFAVIHERKTFEHAKIVSLNNPDSYLNKPISKIKKDGVIKSAIEHTVRMVERAINPHQFATRHTNPYPTFWKTTKRVPVSSSFDSQIGTKRDMIWPNTGVMTRATPSPIDVPRSLIPADYGIYRKTGPIKSLSWKKPVSRESSKTINKNTFEYKLKRNLIKRGNNLIKTLNGSSKKATQQDYGDYFLVYNVLLNIVLKNTGGISTSNVIFGVFSNKQISSIKNILKGTGIKAVYK